MRPRLLLVILMLLGAGVGALVAYNLGVRSWLDAKLFLVAGVVCGYAFGIAAIWLLGRKQR